MTKEQEKILARIRKLDAQMSKEVAEIEKSGKRVISKYNRSTNKDELYITEA